MNAEREGSALRFGLDFTRTVSVDNQVNDRVKGEKVKSMKKREEKSNSTTLNRIRLF